jgi:hypothetical protein
MTKQINQQLENFSVNEKKEISDVQAQKIWEQTKKNQEIVRNKEASQNLEDSLRSNLIAKLFDKMDSTEWIEEVDKILDEKTRDFTLEEKEKLLNELNSLVESEETIKTNELLSSMNDIILEQTSENLITSVEWLDINNVEQPHKNSEKVQEILSLGEELKYLQIPWKETEFDSFLRQIESFKSDKNYDKLLMQLKLEWNKNDITDYIEENW